MLNRFKKSRVVILVEKKSYCSPREYYIVGNLDNARYMFLKIEFKINFNIRNYS
jgi:hypothetical protein